MMFSYSPINMQFSSNGTNKSCNPPPWPPVFLSISNFKLFSKQKYGPVHFSMQKNKYGVMQHSSEASVQEQTRM